MLAAEQGCSGRLSKWWGSFELNADKRIVLVEWIEYSAVFGRAKKKWGSEK